MTLSITSFILYLIAAFVTGCALAIYVIHGRAGQASHLMGKLAEQYRGAPRALIGVHPGSGQHNWRVSRGQILAAKNMAAGAFAFIVAESVRDGAKLGPKNANRTIQASSMRFALWWHGLATNQPPHHSMSDDYRIALHGE